MTLVAFALLALLVQGPEVEGTDSQGPRANGEPLAVYLVTFGPGRHVWERFGHNAILIRDTTTGLSRAYDYGRFSFEAAGFVREFARGRMRYWMGVEDGDALLQFYVQRGRSVWLQELALAPSARARLRDLLEADWARDRGRYRYDYYRDNCSTRLRDALDAVLGGAIRSALDTVPSGTTWRWHTRRSLEHNAFQYFGVDASLGPAADQEISRHDETFLPLKLRDYLRDVRVPAADGPPVPLVRAEMLLAESDRYGVPDRPSNRAGAHLLAGLALGGVLAGLGRWGGTSPGARRAFVTLAALWALLAGLGGAVLAFFWALSDHAIAYRNANVLQFNLLALVLFALLAGAARDGIRRLGQARLAALAVVGLAVGGLVLAAMPWSVQANLPVIAFVLPVHLGVAAGLSLLAAAPAPSAIRPGPG